MKDALLLQAKYNQFASKNMFSVFAKVDNKILYEDCGLYYGSIIKTFEHALCGEIGIFLGNFSAFADKKPKDLEKLLGYLQPDYTLSKEVLQSPTKLNDLSQSVSAAILEIITHTHDFSQIQTVSFPGIEFKKSLGHLMLAILNHSIHHRGQIAAALDRFKIENDFAGMLGM